MLEIIRYRASQHEQEPRVAPTHSPQPEASEFASQCVACSGRSRASRAALVASFRPVVEHFRPKRVHRTYVNEMWSRMRKINQGVAVVRKEIQAHQPKNARSGQIWSGTEGGIPYGRQLGCQRSGSRPPLGCWACFTSQVEALADWFRANTCIMTFQVRPAAYRTSRD